MLEVVYVEGGGITSVYAHVNFLESQCRVGGPVRAGQQIGVVRWDLKDPHLHWEVWIDGKAVAASTPAELLRKLQALSQPDEEQPSDWAAAAWRKAVKAKVFDGTSPQGNVTREMMAALLDKLGLIPD